MKSRIGNRTSQTITSDGALTTALMTTTTTTLQFDSNLYVRYAHHGHEPLYLLSTNNMLFIWWCFFFHFSVVVHYIKKSRIPALIQIPTAGMTAKEKNVAN